MSVKAFQSLSHILKISSGRGKMCSFIYYFTKFIKIPLNILVKITDKLDIIIKESGLLRLFMNFGKQIDQIFIIQRQVEIFKAQNRLNKNLEFYVFNSINLANQLTCLFSQLADDFSFFIKINLIQKSNFSIRLGKIADFAFLMEIIFQFILINTEIYSLTKQIPQIEQFPDKKKQLFSEIDSKILQLIQNSLYIPIAINLSKPDYISPIYLGLAGTLASYVGIIQMWDRNI